MRHYSISAMTVALAASMALASCEIEHSSNGDLDGMWQLRRIDTLRTGGVCDMSQHGVYWCVQARLLYLKDIEHVDNSYFMRFRQTADSLVLTEPYLYRWHQDQEDGGDHPVTDPTVLAPWGINNLEEGYAKEHLSGSRMTLKNDRLRLYFKKF